MKKKIAILMAFFAMCQTMAFAAPIDSAEENPESGAITIKGTLPKSGEYSLEVVKAELSSDDLKNLTNATVMDNVAYLKYGNSEDAMLNLSFSMGDSESGKYIIRVYTEEMDVPFEYNLNYYKKEEIQETFNEFKESGSAADVASLLSDSEKCDKLGLSNAMLESLSASGISEVASKLYADKNNISNVEKLRTAFVENAIANAIVNADADKAYEMLVQVSGIIGIETDETYKEFYGADDNLKKDTMKRFADADIDKKEDVLEYLKEAYVLAQIENAESATGVKKIIAENEEIFKNAGALTKYFDSKNTSGFDSEAAGKNYKNMAEIDDAYTRYSKKNTGNSKPSGGGGGSVGGNVMTYPSEVISETKNDTLIIDTYFDDMEKHWAKTAVAYLAEKGVVSGRGNKTFSPEDNVTREEFVKMLVNAFKIPKSENDIPFADVKKDTWYYEFIRDGYNAGIINGLSSECFGVGARISRQDMSVLVYRILSKQCAMPENEILGFEDKIQISEYAREAVASLKAANIISGINSGIFAPQNNATRAQAAYIIYNAIQYAETN